jgi:hypothetical protein
VECVTYNKFDAVLYVQDKKRLAVKTGCDCVVCVVYRVCCDCVVCVVYRVCCDCVVCVVYCVWTVAITQVDDACYVCRIRRG